MNVSGPAASYVQLRKLNLYFMKAKLIAVGPFLFLAMLFGGCVSLPPIVKVEHRDTPSDQAIVSRLDAIDHRLDQLEKNSAKQ